MALHGNINLINPLNLQLFMASYFITVITLIKYLLFIIFGVIVTKRRRKKSTNKSLIL